MLRFATRFVVVCATCAACSPDHAPTPPTTLQTQPTPRPTPQPTVGPVTPLAVGTVVEATVSASDPKCYPMWDSKGGCLWFRVLPSQSGDLTVTLRSVRPGGEVDLFLMTGGTLTWIAPGADRASRGSVPVVAGSEIDILVIAYVFPESFFLETALQ